MKEGIYLEKGKIEDNNFHWPDVFAYCAILA